jgi:hypothetical protein
MRTLRRVAICLLLIEGMLQLYHRVTQGRWSLRPQPYKVEHIVRQDDKRAYSYKPNFRDENEGVSIDQFGFRASPRVPGLEAGSAVIACLGDSVPFGHGLRDEETYPFDLNELLKASRSPVSAINAGVQSYNLQQSIEHFYLDVLAHYQPVAVTLQAANDVGLLLTYRSSWTPESTWAPYRPNGQAFLGSSATVHYATEFAVRALVLLARAGLLAYPIDEMLANEERLLREFIGVCASRHIKVVLLPINPFYYQTKRTEKNPELSRWAAWKSESMEWESVIDRFNDVLIRIAHRYGPGEGVYLFDVRAYLDDHDREPLYTDFIHHSPEGSRRVAQGLFEFVKAAGIVTF